MQTPDLLRTTRFIRFDSLVLNGSLEFFSSSPLTQIGSTGTNEEFQSWNCNLKPFDTMLLEFTTDRIDSEKLRKERCTRTVVLNGSTGAFRVDEPWFLIDRFLMDR